MSWGLGLRERLGEPAPHLQAVGLPSVGILLWLSFPPLLPAESSKTLPLAQPGSPGWALGKGTELGTRDPGGAQSPSPQLHSRGDRSSVSVCPGVLQQVITAVPQALFPAVSAWVAGSGAGVSWSYTMSCKQEDC